MYCNTPPGQNALAPAVREYCTTDALLAGAHLTSGPKRPKGIVKHTCGIQSVINVTGIFDTKVSARYDADLDSFCPSDR
jgi:hypothetical protein